MYVSTGAIASEAKAANGSAIPMNSSSTKTKLIKKGLSYQEAACQVCFAANQRALCSTLKHNQLFVL